MASIVALLVLLAPVGGAAFALFRHFERLPSRKKQFTSTAHKVLRSFGEVRLLRSARACERRERIHRTAAVDLTMRARSRLLAALVALTLALPAAAGEPAWVSAIADHFRSLPSPAAEPERWLLAHIDVETTGLAPGWHETIDIGVVITELDGRELDRLFVRIMPAHPERLDPGAAAVNGFSVERWQRLGSVTEAEAVDALRAFHLRVAGDRPVLFTAYNSWFDIAFVDHLFRAQDASWRELWHYHVLDVPSMAWGLGHRDLFGDALASALDVEEETGDPLEHTGITGALANVEKYRALVRRVGEAP